MATGLEVLGGVAASLELVKITKSCLSTFNELRNADIQARAQGDIQFHFIVQGLKFDRWCSLLGIQNMFELSEMSPSQWQQKVEVKEFEDLLQDRLRFRSHNLVTLVLRTLKSMEQKFSEAEKLMVKYSVSTDTQAPFVSPTPSRKHHFTLPRVLKRTKQLSLPSSDMSAEDISSIRGRIARPISKMQWVATDKKTAQDILKSIVKVNDSLVGLLESIHQAQINRQINLAILDSVEHQERYITQILPRDSEVRALVGMRLWQARGLKESEDNASSYSGTSFGVDARPARHTTYSTQDFKKNTIHLGESRSFSILGGESVVVEWKYFSKDRPFSVEQSFRLMDLVQLLNTTDLYKKFQALPCKGYVTDNENFRVGMIFSTGHRSTMTPQSLQGAIHGTTETPPPVGERFAIARRFVLAIHNLHAVQWLHKGIRSDNILCFQDIGSKDNLDILRENKPTDPTGETDPIGEMVGSKEKDHHLTKAPSPLPTFYLLGWDLSRPDHPEELSESISVSTLGFQTKLEAIRMYTHPDAFSAQHLSPGKRLRYRPQWDMYSIGLILLEVGLWRTLDTIRRKVTNDDDFRLRVRTEYCDRLQAKMGLVYWRVVQRCLNDDFELSDEGVSGHHDFSLQVAFEKQVVFELERCYA
ncbi:hypothetical protein F5B22DRAFT_631643 [Xylaria bambusicola]|uniref:uncharacterized protein n=1 Tax=Xylaria bambusicola TaxID=326684 RepID=UPI00200895D9|nr:uncharacterized protein F5B22DRAFT_631643 [Xylaria bambusicola]KAI0502868.1 hypothetical protein F5B22DRAFT_631643 [Xylaria bambusicola]